MAQTAFLEAIQPSRILQAYNHFHTGTNIRFGSLDRPSTLAGSSYVYVFGDEVKYFKEEKIANLMKAVRGYSVQYGNSPFYRGYSFTTDMPDVSHIGEYDWILKGASAMNTERLTLVMQAGLVYNQALHEYVAAKLEWQRTRTPEAEREYKNKLRTARLWRSRWVELRRLPETATFFMLASSYINVDILTAEWFDDAFAEQFSDYKAAILSMKRLWRAESDFMPTSENGTFTTMESMKKHTSDSDCWSKRTAESCDIAIHSGRYRSAWTSVICVRCVSPKKNRGYCAY